MAANTKDSIIQQVKQEAAMSNARQLVQSINSSCYEKCVIKPADSLSSGEQKCFTACMEKYMSAWNAVSRTYVHRLQQESQRREPLGAISGLDPAS